MSPRGKWYVSVAAVHAFADIAGYPNDEEHFYHSEQALFDLCDEAILYRPAIPPGHKELWLAVADIDGKHVRIQMVVSHSKRKEGNLPQLIFVRKHDSQPGKNGLPRSVYPKEKALMSGTDVGH